MRKLYLFLLIVFPVFYTYGQSPVERITHEYFRSDPFDSDFSSFVKHLMNDPTLSDKVIEKRTDTSLFFFRGTYKNHNPFFFKPRKIEVLLMEAPVKLDSFRNDTIYIYQLFAFTIGTKEGTQEIKKEFEKIYKRYKSSFYKNTLKESLETDTIKSATYNFFERLFAVAPFALSWVGPDENKEVCLVLTVRIDKRNNKAALPVPLYAF